MVFLKFSVLALVIGSSLASPLIQLNSSSTLSDTKPKDQVNYRLPNNTKPLDYKVHLETKVHENIFDFSGEVNIKIEALETNADSKIVVHARLLTISKVEFYYTNGSLAKNIGSSYDPETEFLTIFSTSKNLHLVKGLEYRVIISYNGTLREDNGGFYRSSYINSSGKKKFLATTQFESTDARHGFPCYDEPGIKANFTISITHGKAYHAISNMIIQKNETKGEMRTTTFISTRKMSTYLVAFVVSDFEYTSKIDSKSREERVYSRPGSKCEQEFALDTSVKTLLALENYLMVDYDLIKMDQVAVPDFAAGAMENWGLVTYREEYLLFKPNKSSIYTETNIASIIAHEYAHQWFGNLVSPKWWTFIWLNEGFASLFSYIGTDKVYPKWDFMQYFIVAEYQRALGADVGASARPMTHYVEKPKEIVGLFDSISYSKAACVLRMLQHVVTEKVFAEGLTSYLNEKKFAAAEEDDLISGLDKAIKRNKKELPEKIRVILKSWTNQGGFPLLTVTRNYKDGSFKIEQQTFHDDPTTIDKKLWWVPYNFVTANNNNFGNTNFEGFLKNEKSVEVKPSEKKSWTNNDWVILNAQQTGYYRVNYDDNNWKLIIDALKKDPSAIHNYNKAQLINDAFRLVISKRLPVKTFFSLLSYLSKEESYVPWVSGAGALSTFNLFMKSDTNGHYFDFFIRGIVDGLYKKLGTKDKPDEEHFKKYTRAIAIKWACEAAVTDCLQTTNARLIDYINKGIAIEPNLEEVIFCYGLKKATDGEFNSLFKKLMDSVDAAERQLLITSLGCSVSPKQLELFLSSSVSKNATVTLRPQEKIVLLRSAYSRSQAGFSAAAEFLTKHYAEYFILTPGFTKINPLADDIIRMSNVVVNSDQKLKLEKILQLAEANIPTFDKQVSKSVAKNIQSNLEWINTYHADVVGWLKDYEKANKSGAMGITVVPILLFVGSLLRYVF